MKIAFVTDDGKTISRHFGRAAYYLVVTLEDKTVKEQELREKLGHRQFTAEGHDDHTPGQQHGYDPASQSRHSRMAATIQDCQVVVCGGMGMGAYESMKAANLKPIVTEKESITEALQAYLDGTLTDQAELVH